MLVSKPFEPALVDIFLYLFYISPSSVHHSFAAEGGGGGGGRTVLVVRASDSGSGDPGSILGRVGVLFP